MVTGERGRAAPLDVKWYKGFPVDHVTFVCSFYNHRRHHHHYHFFFLRQQFMLGNYSFQIKALDPVNNTVQEGYQFVKPIKISMFYDVGNLVQANQKHVNNELTKEDVDPVLYLWDPENETWLVCFSLWLK